LRRCGRVVGGRVVTILRLPRLIVWLGFLSSEGS